MHLWERLASPRWWSANEEALRSEAGENLTIIGRPDRKRITIEVACRSRVRAKQFVRRFGGRSEKLPRDWLKRFARAEETKPLRIGPRLVVFNVGGTSVSRHSRRPGLSHLFIPAGAAFGTGQHVTTAMSLRLIEELTAGWTQKWSMIDLGTGSGILALAGKRFGATRVLGIDIDPMAISTAEGNARLNKIRDVDFTLADVRRWKRKFDVVTANLFSELLIQILQNIAHSRWLIASGVLRSQEPELIRALHRNKFRVVTVRRHGKWIALLAGRSGPGGTAATS